MPEIATKYLGSLEYSEGDVIQFPSGLPAFEDQKQFLLIEPPASKPLVFLQSLRQANLCFLTLPIQMIDPKYRLDVKAEELAILGLDHISPATTCLAILAVTENGQVTANLLAPLVIDRTGRCGLQSIRIDSAYSHQHTVTPLSGVQSGDACS